MSSTTNAFALVTVKDMNDNSPVFKENLYFATVAENVTFGTFLLQVQRKCFRTLFILQDKINNSELSLEACVCRQTLFNH